RYAGRHRDRRLPMTRHRARHEVVVRTALEVLRLRARNADALRRIVGVVGAERGRITSAIRAGPRAGQRAEPTTRVVVGAAEAVRVPAVRVRLALRADPS